MSDFASVVEVIEAAYEFTLAYAAQGFEAGQPGQHEADVRRHLEDMSQALERLGGYARAAAEAHDGFAERGQFFLDTLERDAAGAAGVVGLVLSRQGISSQLIDNFNASNHIRTILTDIFLFDEALK
jgi:hypothetical protein